MRQKITRDGCTAAREEGTAMDDLYSLAGVIDMRARLAGLVRALATERGVRLYPERPVFDFAMSLPAPGVPWKLMLHSPLGRSATVMLSSEHLEDFRAGWRSPVISRIGQALDTLSAS
jgi:hypothetical protein